MSNNVQTQEAIALCTTSKQAIPTIFLLSPHSSIVGFVKVQECIWEKEVRSNGLYLSRRVPWRLENPFLEDSKASYGTRHSNKYAQGDGKPSPLLLSDNTT